MSKYTDLIAALTAALTMLRKGGYIGDAAEGKWITLSNGSAVELDANGNVVKGMGGSQKGVPIKEAAKNMAEGNAKQKTGEHRPASHGKEPKTPSGEDKTTLSLRDRAALTNAGKFTTKANAESSRNGQKYYTNILQGEGGQLWVPSTNREESILTRLGYKKAK